MEDWINYMIDEEGKDVISEDDGLISFKVINGEMYVCDFFVKEEKRGSGVAISLARKAEDHAREMGCNRMTCNIFINKSNKKMFAHKVRIFTNFGFLPVSAQNDAITMIKEI